MFTVSRLSDNCIGGYYDVIADYNDYGHNYSDYSDDNFSEHSNDYEFVANTGGIIALCEWLKGSSVTSLECAAPTPSVRLIVCQRPLPYLRSRLRSRARSLRDNCLGPEGGAALAEGLKGNSTLQSLE